MPFSITSHDVAVIDPELDNPETETLALEDWQTDMVDLVGLLTYSPRGSADYSA